jgi:type I restriction enzyme M protein
MSKITKEIYHNKDNEKEARRLAMEIAGCLREAGNSAGSNIPVAAYLLYKVGQYNDPFGISMREIIDKPEDINENICYLAKERFSEELWERLLQLVTKYSSEQFALAALLQISEDEPRGAMTTPDSILKLVHKILDVSENDSVADFCCGYGSYLILAALEEGNAHYYGYDINTEKCSIAQMRSELIDANVQVDRCDVFCLAEGDNTRRFDKIFANYPFGIKLKNLDAGAGYLARYAERYPGLSKATSSDWVFNSLLCDLLSETGKAVGIMTNGSTWNSVDTPMRKYFVERKMVECVISLPNRMFGSTNIPTTLIVLSHDNDSVRMIDATKICQQGRRQNEFSDEDVSTIMEAFSADSEYSKQVSLEELRSNEYTLSLSRYARENLSFSNGAPFESVIKSITRGAPCTANQLDKMVSDEITDTQYLMLSNIQDGIIDDKLPYLSSIAPKYEKHCLKNNSLILSKNSYPYKIAVATVMEGQHILASGNLYIIELDEEKANPYYLKAFFDSEQGHAVLRSITVGATIPNIGIDKLRKVEIPLPPMEVQNRIALKYQSALDEVSVTKLRLEKAINKLHHIFDEE